PLGTDPSTFVIPGLLSPAMMLNTRVNLTTSPGFKCDIGALRNSDIYMQPNLSSKFMQYFGVQDSLLPGDFMEIWRPLLSCPLLAVFLTSWNLKALLTRRFRIGMKRSNLLLLPRFDLSTLAFRLHKAKLESLFFRTNLTMNTE
ncbi:hypothetical protein K443DRAFT_101166, partial [Laccaria amethystina LaAM-08-1]